MVAAPTAATVLTITREGPSLMAIKTLPAITLVATVLLVSACSLPNYIPVHGQSIEETAGARLECKAIAEGVTPGIGGGFVAAAGKPAFVGGVMGGYALGLAIAAAARHQAKLENYDDCMVSRGFRKSEPGSLAATPAAPVLGGLPTP